MFAHRRLAAQHDGIRLFIDRVRHVRHLGARWMRVLDHAFEHVRRDDERLAHAHARLHDPPLDDRQLFVRTFNAEIATRDHDGVRLGHDGVKILDCLLVLDLRHDLRPPLRIGDDRPQLQNILRLTHERQRDEIHPHLQPHRNVRQIFSRQRGQADLHAGQIDMSSAAELSRRQHFTLNLVAKLLQHAHVDRPVVHEHDVALADVVDEILVVHVHRVHLLARLAAHREREFFTRLQIQLARQIARADRRPLSVEQDADKLPLLLRGGADLRHDAADPVMRRVRHVQPRDIHAGGHQLPEHLRRFRGGAEGGDNFCASHKQRGA